MAERSQRYFAALLGFAFAAAWFAIGFEAALGCLCASAFAYVLATVRQRRTLEGMVSLGAPSPRGNAPPARSKSRRVAAAGRRADAAEGRRLAANPVLGAPIGQDGGPYGW
jgi:hypothetical protein